jgi:hypothetical protein
MESIGCIHDCCLVREVQGGDQPAFQQLVHAYDPGRSTTRVSDHRIAERCPGFRSRSISEGLQQASPWQQR